MTIKTVSDLKNASCSVLIGGLAWGTPRILGIEGPSYARMLEVTERDVYDFIRANAHIKIATGDNYLGGPVNEPNSTAHA